MITKRDKRLKARELRQAGWAIHEIATELGVVKDTVSKWVQDIELTDIQKEALSKKNHLWVAQHTGAQNNKNKAFEMRLKYQENGREKAQGGSL